MTTIKMNQKELYGLLTVFGMAWALEDYTMYTAGLFVINTFWEIK